MGILIINTCESVEFRNLTYTLFVNYIQNLWEGSGLFP
jgi:hypothetical protein